MIIINVEQKCQTLNTITLLNFAEFFSKQLPNGFTYINTNLQGHPLCVENMKATKSPTIKSEGDLKQLFTLISTNHDEDILMNVSQLHFNLLVSYLSKSDILKMLKKQNIPIVFILTIQGGLFMEEDIKKFYLLSTIDDIKIILIDDERSYSTKIQNKYIWVTKAYKMAKKGGKIYGEIYLKSLNDLNITRYIDQIKSLKCLAELKKWKPFIFTLNSGINKRNENIFKQVFFPTTSSFSIKQQREVIAMEIAKSPL